jgi:hypothetical protein
MYDMGSPSLLQMRGGCDRLAVIRDAWTVTPVVTAEEGET